MAISSKELLELAKFKFALRYDSARPLPRDVRVPERGVWKHTATNITGEEIQTLSARLGSDLLEVKHYPVESPQLVRSNQGDIWFFDVSQAPLQKLRFHLSERVESGISVGLTPNGGHVDEIVIPPGLMKSMKNILLAI